MQGAVGKLHLLMRLCHGCDDPDVDVLDFDTYSLNDCASGVDDECAHTLMALRGMQA